MSWVIKREEIKLLKPVGSKSHPAVRDRAADAPDKNADQKRLELLREASANRRRSPRSIRLARRVRSNVTLQLTDEFAEGTRLCAVGRGRRARALVHPSLDLHVGRMMPSGNNAQRGAS